MEQKIKLRLYIKGKMRPLFTCKIVDNTEETINGLQTKLNDKSLEVITFGQVCFKRSDFKYYEITYLR